MTQPDSPSMLASFQGVEDRSFDSIQSAMEYAETLYEPTGFIGFVSGPGSEPVKIYAYAGGDVQYALPGQDEQTMSNKEEWT